MEKGDKKEYFNGIKNRDTNWDPLIHITQPNSISFYIKSCQKFILALDWCVCASQGIKNSDFEKNTFIKKSF